MIRCVIDPTLDVAHVRRTGNCTEIGRTVVRLVTVDVVDVETGRKRPGVQQVRDTMSAEVISAEADG